MKTTSLLVSISLLGCACCWGETAAPAAAPTVEPLNLHADVTPGLTPQEVVFMERDFKPGETSGWHLHHGVEMTYVLKGEMELRVLGSAPRRLHAGDHFRIERDVPHEGRNVGHDEAAMIICYLKDKSAPMKVPVAEPAPAPAGVKS